MRIFLSGFMGAGKTTVGRKLADRLGWSFVDLDQEVEQRAGLDVREIFELHGEPEFRRLERETLAASWERDRVVVAVGGGTLVDAELLESTRRRGRVVWLDVPFETLVRRIGFRGKRNRPLFRNETEAHALYRQRLAAYRRSDLSISVGPDSTPDEIAARIQIELRLPEAACTS